MKKTKKRTYKRINKAVAKGICAYYRAGNSMQDCGVWFGRHPETIRWVLHRGGVTIRHQGRWKTRRHNDALRQNMRKARTATRRKAA